MHIPNHYGDNFNMRRTKLTYLTLLATATGLAHADVTLQLNDATARINYSLGYQIGNDFKQQGIKTNSQAIVKGIEDALAGGKPLLDPQEMHTTLVELKRKVVAEQQSKRQEADLVNVAADKKYLEEAVKRPGMQTTQSGLIYKIIDPGKGQIPNATDTVTVNYLGTLTDGNEFDSSYKRGKPANFPLNGVIKGWTEGLQLIKEGGKIQLVIPPELAYGDHGPLAHRTLIFDVELIAVANKISPPENKAGPAKND